MRKLAIFLCIVISLSSVVSSQDELSDDFPTLQMLQEVITPINDPLDLAQRLRGVDEIAPPPTTAPEWHIGDRQTFTANNSLQGNTFDVDAVLRAAGDHVYIWVEDGANVSDSELRDLVNAWDSHIYDRTRALWGSEALPGIDGDEHVYMLLAHNLGSTTAAYFSRQHTFPKEAFPSSNEHEMFFYNLDSSRSSLNDPYVESVLSHEFQHMIRANLDANEDSWLGEGFSTFTELYLGYDGPLWFVDAYLNQPSRQLNTFGESGDSDRPVDYGAAMLFVTYFYERYGIEALNAFSEDPANGLISMDGILRSMGEPGVDEFFADWVLANAIWDTKIEDGRYGYELLPDSEGIHVDAIVTNYPFEEQNRLNQYGAAYYVFARLDDYDTLQINIEMQDTVALIPAQAYSGDTMWYSNRGDASNMTLTKSFDLSGVGKAVLDYRVWHEIEENWDYAYLVVSTDGGVHWDILETPNTSSEDPFGVSYGSGYTGNSGGWLHERVLLDDYVGQEILVRFEMVTDDAVNLPGIAIDDVAIDKIGYFSDFEDDDGGWVNEGWIRMDNILPQRAWIQAIQYSEDDEVTISRWQAPDDGGWLLTLVDDVDFVILSVSPFAAVTTVPLDYSLAIAGQ
jgi:immune inhibitor A